MSDKLFEEYYQSCVSTRDCCYCVDNHKKMFPEDCYLEEVPNCIKCMGLKGRQMFQAVSYEKWIEKVATTDLHKFAVSRMVELQKENERLRGGLGQAGLYLTTEQVLEISKTIDP